MKQSENDPLSVIFSRLTQGETTYVVLPTLCFCQGARLLDLPGLLVDLPI